VDYFLTVRPFFIDTSELLSLDGEWQSARDYLWKKLEEEQAALVTRLSEDDIEGVYVELAGRSSALYTEFRNALLELDLRARARLDGFRLQTQAALEGSKGVPTASVSTDLRKVTRHAREQMIQDLSPVLEPIRGRLLELVQRIMCQNADRRTVKKQRRVRKQLQT
jgi:hypothetical protein